MWISGQSLIFRPHELTTYLLITIALCRICRILADHRFPQESQGCGTTSQVLWLCYWCSTFHSPCWKNNGAIPQGEPKSWLALFPWRRSQLGICSLFEERRMHFHNWYPPWTQCKYWSCIHIDSRCLDYSKLTNSLSLPSFLTVVETDTASIWSALLENQKSKQLPRDQKFHKN